MNDNTAVWPTNNEEITRLRREDSGLPDWNVNISITAASSVFLSGISSRNWLINWAVWIFTVASLREGLTERRRPGEWTTMGSHFFTVFRMCIEALQTNGAIFDMRVQPQMNQLLLLRWCNEQTSVQLENPRLTKANFCDFCQISNTYPHKQVIISVFDHEQWKI